MSLVPLFENSLIKSCEDLHLGNLLDKVVKDKGSYILNKFNNKAFLDYYKESETLQKKVDSLKEDLQALECSKEQRAFFTFIINNYDKGLFRLLLSLNDNELSIFPKSIYKGGHDNATPLSSDTLVNFKNQKLAD
jgi:hypothetical protein